MDLWSQGREMSALKKKKLVGKMEGIHFGGLTVLANKNSNGDIFIFCHSNSDIFTCEDIKFSCESSPGISLVFI